MGASSSKPNSNENRKNESKIENERINECIIETSSSLKSIDRTISKVCKSICKIEITTSFGTIKRTGFLLAIWVEQKRFYFLMSNEHVIKNELLYNNINIMISYDFEFKSANINLNDNKRYMKSFIDIGLDITVVEILEKDKISKNYFLSPEKEKRINNKLINNPIYITQYPGDRELMYAKGKIKEIKKYEFIHLTKTMKGSSGSPIFLDNRIYVMGIHKQTNKNKTLNYGDFIYPANKIIKNDIRKI